MVGYCDPPSQTCPVAPPSEGIGAGDMHATQVLDAIVASFPGTAPHMNTICLPDIIARDQISQASPLPYLHTASDQMLAVGMAWERG